MTPPDNPSIQREAALHGARWNAVHGGYFSDPAVAAPLVAQARDLIARSRAEAIADLGGGTGFLLSQLAATAPDSGKALVVLDDSSAQLNAARESGFLCRRGSVDSFCRRDLIPGDSRAFFLMRSVLHYFGRKGLRRVLRHVRNQTAPGEYFLHQTASFLRRADAECLNALYGMMRTPKWYPDIALLRRCLEIEGWRVVDIQPAAPLCLESGELMERYHLDAADIHRIRERLSGVPGVPDTVWTPTPHGFRAFLHYWTFACTPAPASPAPDPPRSR